MTGPLVLALLGTFTADGGDVSLLFTGDSHSHLDATGPKDAQLRGTLGGLTKAATVVSQVKATDPNALFVHAGDLFNGELYFAATIGPDGSPALATAEMQILAMIGLDVLTLGNHEFGVGTDALAATLDAGFQGTGPTVLSANVDLAAAGLTQYAVPRTVKVVDGVRVGFFGLTIQDYMSLEAPFLPGGNTPEGVAAIAASEAELLTLPPYDADVVVCVAHLGIQAELAVATQVPGIDVVIGGHDHVTTDEPIFVEGPDGRDVAVVKAGQFYQNLGYLHLTYDAGQVTFPSYELLTVDESVPRLPQVDAIVQGLQATISAHYGEDFWGTRIGYAAVDIDKDFRPPLRDTGIGNLIADALRLAGGTDIGMIAEGFFTEGIYRGPIVGADVFRAVGNGIDPAAGPGFALYRVPITGQNLLNALETSVALMGTAQGLTPDDFFLQVSGMRWQFDSTRTEPPFVQRVRVHGRPLDLDRVYTVTVDYGNLVGVSLFPNVEFAGEPELVEGVDEYAAVRNLIARRRVIAYGSRGRAIDLGQIPSRR